MAHFFIYTILALMFIIGPIVLIAAFELRTRHGEIWRPLLGWALCRKPLLQGGLQPGHRIHRLYKELPRLRTLASLDAAYKAIYLHIIYNSHFRLADLATLKRTYSATRTRIVAENAKKTRAQASGTQRQGAAPRKPSAPAGWRAVLGLPAHASDVATIKKAYRGLAKIQHPDRGGDPSAMAKTNIAYASARAELGFV